MTINLCLVSPLFHPYYSGGAQRYMGYLPGFAKRDICVQVFSGTPSNQRAAAFDIENTWSSYNDEELLPIDIVNHTPVHRVRLPDSSKRQRTLTYGKCLLRFSNQSSPKFDLIQFLPMPLWLMPSVLRLRRQNIPIISTYNLLSVQLKKPFDHQVFFRRLSMQLVDTTIVQSSFMLQELRQLGVKTPIEVIPNGVNCSRFQPAQSIEEKHKIRDALGLPANDILLLSVGSVEPRKGIDNLLESWSELAPNVQNVQLLIVGPRPYLENPKYGGFQQKVEQILNGLEEPERIHFVGQVQNVADYFKAADIFVFTSRREGLPNVLLEAMASSLPVITTPFIGISEELGKVGDQYCLVDRDPVQLSTAIKRLIDNRDLRENLGKSGLNWVNSKMSLDQTLDKHANLYRKLSENNHR